MNLVINKALMECMLINNFKSAELPELADLTFSEVFNSLKPDEEIVSEEQFEETGFGAAVLTPWIAPKLTGREKTIEIKREEIVLPGNSIEKAPEGCESIIKGECEDKVITEQIKEPVQPQATTEEKQAVKAEHVEVETEQPVRDTKENLVIEARYEASHKVNVNPPEIKQVEKQEPYKQIAQEIKTRMNSKMPDEFRIQLEPKELGQIDIKLRLEKGKLLIHISAESSSTHKLLSSQVDKLVMNMGLSKVQVENVQINYQVNQPEPNQENVFELMNEMMDFSHRRQQQQTGGRQANLNSLSQGMKTIVEDGNSISPSIDRYSQNMMDYTV